MIDLLIARAGEMGVEMSREQAEKFEIYHKMLIERNAQFNLTRVPDDLSEAIDRNYLDCIAPLAKGFPNVRTAVDVGSGAGFPGIPLSIMCPDVRFTLMDALDKRVQFLNDVIRELELNAEAVHLRAEDGARKTEYREKFDLAAARAVASLNLLSEYLLPFVRVGGVMLCYKGPNLDEELDAASNALKLLGGRVKKTEDAFIPGRDWAHKLCWIEKTAPTPEKYPRKAGKPEKNPL